MEKLTKQVRILILVSIVLSIGLIPTTVSASGADYTTEKFNTNVVVNENNSYEITEKITVNFASSRHGIFRNIPTASGEMVIDDVVVDGENFEFYKEDGNYVIKIGSENRTVVGRHTYTIKYLMRVYDDRDNTKDTLYLDLIPTYWETPIKSVSSTLIMPKKVDWNEVNIYSGIYGNGDIGNVTYSINRNKNKITIRGKKMELSSGVTIKANLPEGYWVDPMDNDWAYVPLLALIILTPIVCFLIWFKWGRDPKFVQTVEFYPPDNMTPAELGYIIDGSAEKNDIVSMIVYFASKKYISIAEYKKNKFELKKLCNISETEPKFAKTLFDALFSGGKKSVHLDDLDEDFGESFMVCKTQLASHFEKSKKRKVFLSQSVLARVISGALLILLSGGCVALSAMYAIKLLLVYIAIPIAFATLLGLLVFITSFDHRDSYGAVKNMVLYAAGMILSGASFGSTAGLIGLFVGRMWVSALFMVSAATGFIFVVLTRARTKKGAELQGRILGFKNFIKSAELEKLKLLVEDDPEYFYRIMPYAYVMGLSDKWAKNFEKIPTDVPNWYSGYKSSVFDAMMFSHVMHSCSRSMASNIHISSGDSGGMSFGSGGGGFSGGGFGGGGGGAW